MMELPEFDAFAHDLRHYLRAMVTSSQLTLRREPNVSQTVRQTLETVAHSGREIDRLISATGVYLNAVRPRANWPLAQLLRRVRLEAKPKLEAAQGCLEIDNRAPEELAVPSNLSPVWLELIENGLKFRRPEQSPQVSFRIDNAGGLLRFEVEDNGIGVAPDYWEKVFQPYARLHPRTEYPGCGLGLPTARRILRALGGDLTFAESNGGARLTGYCNLQAPEGQ